MVVINSATFGDEYSSTDVLKTLQDKLSASGSIDVSVDSSLIPSVTTGETVRLDGPEQEDVKNQAVDICGPSDQTCIEIKSQELAQQKLKEKESQTINSGNIIKGRRLTVKYKDETGEHTVIIPEGQTFALGADAKPDPGFDYEAATSPWKQLFSSVWGIIGTALTTFLYASSIIITWMTFSEFGNRALTIAMTAVSVFIPLSGFGLSFIGAAAPSYFSGDKILRARISLPKT
jgi:hypothetical protein